MRKAKEVFQSMAEKNKAIGGEDSEKSKGAAPMMQDKDKDTDN